MHHSFYQIKHIQFSIDAISLKIDQCSVAICDYSLVSGDEMGLNANEYKMSLLNKNKLNSIHGKEMGM